MEFLLTQNSSHRKIKKFLFLGGQQSLSVMVELDKREDGQWVWKEAGEEVPGAKVAIRCGLYFCGLVACSLE